MRPLVLARQDLRLALRDSTALFWLFLAPFLWVYVFGFVARGGGEQTRIGLLVVQEDASVAAERLVHLLEAQNFEVRAVAPGSARPAGRDAPARSLTIPAGFSEALAERRKLTLELKEERRVNPEGTFAARVALHRAVVRLLAEQALPGFGDGDDPVTVRSSWGGGRTIPSGFYQTIPGNLVMFVLMAAMINGGAILARERRDGILRRLGAAPLSRPQLVAGKALGRAAIAAVQMAVFLIIGLLVFRIDWGSSPAALAVLLVVFVASAASFGLLTGALFTSPEAATGVSIVMVLAMSALGGCWWPAEIMPGWVRAIGHAFPAAWALNGLHEIISWGGGVRDVLPHCAALIAFGLATGAAAVPLLRQRD